MKNFHDLDIVILCGGLGKRLRPLLMDKPKSMANFDGHAFLDLLLDSLFKQGFRKFILCIGYLGKYIKDYYKKSFYAPYIIFSEEKKPLGTGGAVKNAERYIKKNNFIVINGDTFCEVDMKSFLDFHLSQKKALVSMVVAYSDERDDCGYLKLDSSKMITAYAEKKSEGSKRYINAGIYIFNRKILSLIPPNQEYSLERSLFPSLVNNSLYGYFTKSKVLDIGTSERYQQAISYFKNHL